MRKGQTPESKKPALNAGFLVFGALDRIRTCDRSVRSRVLYPAELRVQVALDKPDHLWLLRFTSRSEWYFRRPVKARLFLKAVVRITTNNA